MFEIDNNEFTQYINNNNNLTQLQKKLYINRQLFNANFTSDNIKYSNSILYSLFAYSFVNDKVAYTKATQLLEHFLNPETVTQLLDKIKNNQLIKDKHIYNWILQQDYQIKHSNFKYNNFNKYYKLTNNSKISNVKTSQWTQMLDVISNKTKSYITTHLPNNNKLNYLDIGCGSGSKTKIFGNMLNANIYGTDIEQWGPYEQTKTIKHSFDFKLIQNNVIQYDNNMFDIISCILMLHHVDNLTNLLTQIKNLLKPGGIFIIVEHNITDLCSHLIVDIEHTLYAFLYDGITVENYYSNPKPYAKYNDILQWNYIIESFGFEFKYGSMLYTNLKFEPRYDNIYYAIYQSI